MPLSSCVPASPRLCVKAEMRTSRCIGLSVLLVAGAAVWLALARDPDPFTRSKFSLKTPGGGETKGGLVMPRLPARFPVVMCFGDLRGGPDKVDKVLRRFAELGCAAVGVEYDQKIKGRGEKGAGRGGAGPNLTDAFDAQFAALLEYLNQQRWAQSNAVAWVGFGPKSKAQSLPLRAGSKVQGRKTQASFPFALSTLTLQPSTSLPPPSTLTLQLSTSSDGVVIREAAEYCVAHLPPADYTAGLRGCTLTPAEKERFNTAMALAGRNRGELWKAVAASREPERRTVMMVIGGLEDYDLAHILAGHLREVVQVAWKARRTYPWCRDTPLDVFERFTAAPRVLEEPLGRFQSAFSRRLRQPVKYCRTTAEACDAVSQWRRLRAAWKELPYVEDPTPDQVLANRGGDCRPLVGLYVSLARSVGVAARPVTTTWPTLGTGHYWVEVWDADRRAWHSFDASTANRPYDCDWVLNVPKAATHAGSGERGGWNAATESRWEAYTNTVALCYPSGTVRVRVLPRTAPVRPRRVNVQVWLRGEMVHLTSAVTDSSGEVCFMLGQSARQPYRFVLDSGGEADWEWLPVQAGAQYNLTLHADHSKPFDPMSKPPPLGFPEWRKGEERQ
jgi:hypothetical protein